MPVRYSIIVTGDGTQYEAIANAAITPGQFVELLSTGKVQKVAAAGGDVERLLAIEDYLQGNDVADDYDAADKVMYRAFGRGDKVYAILADGENAAIGSNLVMAGAGEVKVADTSTETIIAKAVEAVDASDSAATAVADRRIVIRIK